MIEKVVNSGESIQLITKRLYPETAKHFGVKPHSVEYALRTLIGTCWAHGDRDALNEIAGRVLTHAPSNAEFDNDASDLQDSLTDFFVRKKNGL